MKTISAIPLALLSGQALGLLSCTVVAPTLTKRLCEADSCPAYDTVNAGASLHAACRADCSTDDDPWLKLYDGTYVRANSATVSGCRYSCQPYSVLGLPRCHEQAGAAKPAGCAASTLKPVQAVPQAVEPNVAALCNQTSASAPAVHHRIARSRVFSPRYINGTFARGVFANGTGSHSSSVQARSETAESLNANSTVASHAPVLRRAPFPFQNSTTYGNETLYARGVNTTINPVMARAHGAVVPRDVSFFNVTVAASPRIHARNETLASTATPTRFVNGTFSATSAGVVGRKPPVIRRVPDLPVRFYA